MAKFHLSSILFVASYWLSIGRVGATMYIVGKSFGWNIPGNLSFYQDWSDARNFTVGDRLIFLYHTGLQNVMEVNKIDYDACTRKHPIKQYYNAPTFLLLTKPGDHYFLCSDKVHCEKGQKLKVTVAESRDSGTGGHAEINMVGLLISGASFSSKWFCNFVVVLVSILLTLCQCNNQS